MTDTLYSVPSSRNCVASKHLRGEFAAMKHWLWLGFAVAMTSAVQAEEKFSQAVRMADFSAAGLSKLTPEELARLDALVADFKSGSLDAAKREVAAAEAKAAQAQADARAAAEKADRLQAEQAKKEAAAAAAAAEKKTKVVAGTKVEYEPLQSRIDGTITGWERRTIFRLENGEYWQVTDNDTYFSRPIVNPKVEITPTALGGYWMKIEGINVRVRVMPMVAGR